MLQKLERCPAPEHVTLALQTLEDLQSTRVAALSVTIALSGVSRHVASLKENLRQFHSVLMSAQANWEDDWEDDSSVLRDVSRESFKTVQVIVDFLEEVQRMIHAPALDLFKNTQPVNFLALHKLKREIMQINSRVQMLNVKDLSKPGRKSITQPPRQFHRNIDEIWLLGLELHQKRIVEELVDSSLQTRSVVQLVGTQQFVRTALAQKIYQRYFKSYIQVTKFIIS